MYYTPADLRGDAYYSAVFMSGKRIVYVGKCLGNCGFCFLCMGPMRTSYAPVIREPAAGGRIDRYYGGGTQC